MAPDIASGQEASAVEVNRVFLKSGIMALCNNHKFQRDTLENSGGVNSSFYSINNLADGQDYLFDGFGDDDAIDSTNTTLVADNEDAIDRFITVNQYISRRAYVCRVLDQFNDSSVDTGIWTVSTSNGTVTEGTELISLNTSQIAASTAAIISDGVSGFDARSFSGDSEIILHIIAQSVAGGENALLQISNGTTHVNLLTFTNQLSNTIRIAIDQSAENAYVSVNGAAFGSAIDISSVTTNWYLRLTLNGGTVAARAISMTFIGYVDGVAGTVNYVSATKTFNDTKSACIPTFDYNGSDSDISVDVSANGGTNYTSATKDTWTNIPNTGTGGKIRLTCTLPTTITGDGTAFNIKEIKAVGGYFDG